jgi:hypothetical protein
MIRVRAVSGEEGLLRRLASGTYRARVHSVFASVVNLECASSGTLQTLACSHVDNAPATLVVDLRSFAPPRLAKGATVRCTGTTLCSGSALEVSLEGVEPWSPALPDWPRAGMPVQWLRDLLDGEGGPRGGEGALGRRLGELTGALEAALRHGDLDRAYAHGARIVGLGRGLTPAGDDYLVGLATISNLPGSPVGDLRPLLVQLADDAAERTNDISRAAMVHAAQGRVRQSIIELVSAMARGDRPEAERRGAQVMGIGASSGADILTGMLAGLELAERRRGTRRQ